MLNYHLKNSILKTMQELFLWHQEYRTVALRIKQCYQSMANVLGIQNIIEKTTNDEKND